MNITLFITLGVLPLVIGYFVVIYNNLVAIKHRVAKAWGKIDVLIASRFNFTARELLEFSEAELSDVNVQSLFNS